MSEITQVEQHIQKWVDQFIISLNLCPFAKAVFPKQTLISVCPETKFEHIHKFAIEQLEYLLQQSETDLATTLVVVPKGLESFYDFLDLLDVLEQQLEDTQLDQHIQIAPFHPNFEFESDEDSQETPATLKTNQSPYPIFHLLRVKQVEQVLTTDDMAEKIVQRNKDVLNELGVDEIEKLFNKICK
ncbi:DUF1415 family protein [Marinicellulosiphila megalodicopiae]|uniref:DUF1415 family protein n=1 Tax=Marinicellulosiphila megalodicopiae TaxID=2724896 RepID=UPI003BAEE347